MIDFVTFNGYQKPLKKLEKIMNLKVNENQIMIYVCQQDVIFLQMFTNVL